jgi:small-conductance mechanosensitive channel
VPKIPLYKWPTEASPEPPAPEAPQPDMSLEATELNVGGLKFKGVYIALLFTIVSTIGGTIWTASTLYGRLESVESDKIEKKDINPLVEQVALVEQQLQDNDISSLQGKLAQLGTNLQTIMTQQAELLAIKERVVEAEKEVTDMKATVQSAKLIVEKVDGFSKQLNDFDTKSKKVDREINDIWTAMDDLANPLQ